MISCCASCSGYEKSTLLKACSWLHFYIHYSIHQLNLLRSDLDAFAGEKVDILLNFIIGERCSALKKAAAGKNIIIILHVW